MVRESESIVASSAISIAATPRREISVPRNRGGILPTVAGRDYRGDISPGNWFDRMAGKIWSRKLAAKNFRYHTDMPERTCRDWASGETEGSATILAWLLRSEDGGRVLDYVMAGSPARWWRELRRARIVTDAYDAQRHRVEQFELALD